LFLSFGEFADDSSVDGSDANACEDVVLDVGRVEGVVDEAPEGAGFVGAFVAAALEGEDLALLRESGDDERKEEGEK